VVAVTGVPPPGPHGGDALVVARALGLDPDEVLDLSQSLNPVAPDPVPVVRRHLESIRRYPDASTATAALADVMGVDRSRILLTNGGAEAIRLVADELGGRVMEPEFSLHPRGGDALWRSNPHNPSGILAGAADRAEVWDEAFYPLASGRWTRGDDGSVVVGSLTKLWACPGLRIGYVLVPPGDEPLLARCRSRQPAWAVNGPALAALPDLLSLVDLVDWSARMADLRDDLVGVLRRRGLEPRPSDANWVLVESPGLRQRLAPLGVVVRDCTSFGMPGVVRIAVPPSSRLEQLESALSKIDGSPELAAPGRRGGARSAPGRSGPTPRKGTP
jgi:histidinol-phosphate/aromatic aminotransferase/cobyric acid decarboxylase-like protein